MSTLNTSRNTLTPRPDEIDPQMPLFKWRNKRHAEGRDFKLLITARDSATGTGKTSLAVWLAHAWDWNGYNPDNATVFVNEYLARYMEAPQGSVLIMDEAEQLDSRRSMSNKNVNFANKWQQLRYRQVDSILTLPTTSALDKRLEELADAWINVHHRGFGVVHRIKVDDYDKSLYRQQSHAITWPDMDDHPMKVYLDRRKDEMAKGAVYDDDDAEEVVDPEKIRKETRDELLRGIYNETDVTQEQLAGPAKISRRRVSQIINEA